MEEEEAVRRKELAVQNKLEVGKRRHTIKQQKYM